jgi:maltose O-acetyltransferase
LKDFAPTARLDSNSSPELPAATDSPPDYVSGAIEEELIAGIDPISGDAATAPARSASVKMGQFLRAEFAGLHLRLVLARLLLALLPIHVGGRTRVWVLRLIGFQIGRGTIMAGVPTITGDGATLYQNLTIGTGCWINIGCVLDLGAAISIGDNVSMGHEVLVLTSSHCIGPSAQRALTMFAEPVTIGSGAWLGSRTTLLPGVTVGAGAVVAAGSVVHQDVAPDTLVAGAPARPVRVLSGGLPYQMELSDLQQSSDVRRDRQ